MPVTREELARRLRAVREACQMKQEDVARQLGISGSTIAQIELGNRAVTSLELDKLAYLYGRDIREFFATEFREEDTVVALFRRHPQVAEDEGVLAALRQSVALCRELTSLEHLLGLEQDIASLPIYPLSPPRTTWNAVQQGERVADEERRRLGLGDAPLPNVADLLETQGVRTVELHLPEDVSGMTLLGEDIGVLIVVNNLLPSHRRVRRRFSFAHEYCHAVLDRDQRGAISRESERDTLAEVRANAFAAAFLMPRTGVEEFVHRLGKGRASRLHADVYDEADARRVQVRPELGSQAIQMHDVVLLAHYFGVSCLAALYRLKNLRFLAERDFYVLKQQEEEGLGKDMAKLLDLPEPDREEACNEFRYRFLVLALEAFRMEKITRAKLRELAEMVMVPAEQLDSLLRLGGWGEHKENGDSSQPGE